MPRSGSGAEENVSHDSDTLRVRAAHFGNFIGKGRERKGIILIIQL